MLPSMFTQATLLHLVIAVGLAVHAMKTGRSQWWLFILLLVPLIGSIAYVVIELIPAIFRSQGAKKSPPRSARSSIPTRNGANA